MTLTRRGWVAVAVLVGALAFAIGIALPPDRAVITYTTQEHQ